MFRVVFLSLVLSLPLVHAQIISPSFPGRIDTSDGTLVGYSFYDYVTNGPTGDRIYNCGDGTMIIGIMAAIDSFTSGAVTRGSYYNYYNGTSWRDTTLWRRAESRRVFSGPLNVFSSDKTASFAGHAGLSFVINNGSPSDPLWQLSTIPNSPLMWPMSAVSGDSMVFVIGGYSADSYAPFFRSTDRGLTWDIRHKAVVDTLSPLYPEYTGPINEYMIAAKNNRVGILVFKTSRNVTFYLSEDNGESFTSTLLYDAAKVDTALEQIPFDSSFFPASHYKMCGIDYPDGTGDIHVDKDGVFHTAWGNRELGYYINTDTLGNPVRDEAGKLQRTFFATDYAVTGISYWNEGMSTYTKAAVPSEEMIGDSLLYLIRGTQGWFPMMRNESIDMSSIGFPSMGTDKDGNIFMMFFGFNRNDLAYLIPGDWYTYMPFGHLYITLSTNNGSNWTTPVDMFPGSLGADRINANIADLVDENIHLLYELDYSPGRQLLLIHHPENKYAVLYKKIPVSSILSDAADDEYNSIDFHMSQNYPNPFNPETSFDVVLPELTFIKIKVFDVLGREIKTIASEEKAAGRYTYRLNMNHYASGIYFCRLETRNASGTVQFQERKIMLLK
jgi:hypothetical protein